MRTWAGRGTDLPPTGMCTRVWGHFQRTPLVFTARRLHARRRCPRLSPLRGPSVLGSHRHELLVLHSKSVASLHRTPGPFPSPHGRPAGPGLPGSEHLCLLPAATPGHFFCPVRTACLPSLPSCSSNLAVDGGRGAGVPSARRNAAMRALPWPAGGVGARLLPPKPPPRPHSLSRVPGHSQAPATQAFLPKCEQLLAPPGFIRPLFSFLGSLLSAFSPHHPPPAAGTGLELLFRRFCPQVAEAPGATPSQLSPCFQAPAFPVPLVLSCHVRATQNVIERLFYVLLAQHSPVRPVSHGRAAEGECETVRHDERGRCRWGVGEGRRRKTSVNSEGVKMFSSKRKGNNKT